MLGQFLSNSKMVKQCDGRKGIRCDMACDSENN